MPDIVTLTINPAIDIFVNVDRVEPTHKLRCSPPKRDPGGGGINVARVAHRLGADVMAIYPIGGADRQIAAAAGRARRHRQPGDAVARRDAREFHGLRGRDRRAIPLRAAGLGAAPGRMGSRARPAGVAAEAAEIRGRERQHAARRAGRFFRARGAPAPRRSAPRRVVDTSGPALAAALEEGVTIIKPNLVELTRIRGRRRSSAMQDRIAACRKLAADGRAEIVALTLGDHGALLVTAERAWRALPLTIEAVSTVGAGDSFLGGLVAALAAGKPLEDAFRVAVAAASAAVLHAGHRLVPAGRREPAIAGRADQGDRARGVTHASPRHRRAYSRASLRALARTRLSPCVTLSIASCAASSVPSQTIIGQYISNIVVLRLVVIVLPRSVRRENAAAPSSGDHASVRQRDLTVQ